MDSGIFSRTVVRPEIMKQPMFSKEKFPDFEKISVEIGFGNGENPVHLAVEEPDTLVVGIELSFSCIMKLLKKTSRLGLNNVRVLKGDARFILRECFDDGVIDGLFMNFPCPWPKKRHIKRRVTNSDFMDTVASILKTGAFFEVVTDEYWYAQAIRDSVAGNKVLSVDSLEENPGRKIRTKYERKWLEEGKNIYLVSIRKKSEHNIERIIQGAEKEMHCKLPGSEILAKDLKQMKGSGSSEGAVHFVFRNTYTDTEERNIFLLECISTDEEFEQKFYFKVVNDPGGAMIKLDATTPVFRTPAVKKALQFLCESLG